MHTHTAHTQMHILTHKPLHSYTHAENVLGKTDRKELTLAHMEKFSWSNYDGMSLF